MRNEIAIGNVSRQSRRVERRRYANDPDAHGRFPSGPDPPAVIFFPLVDVARRQLEDDVTGVDLDGSER
jgi:hypothetical protein